MPAVPFSNTSLSNGLLLQPPSYANECPMVVVRFSNSSLSNRSPGPTKIGRSASSAQEDLSVYFHGFGVYFAAPSVYFAAFSAYLHPVYRRPQKRSCPKRQRHGRR